MKTSNQKEVLTTLIALIVGVFSPLRGHSQIDANTVLRQIANGISKTANAPQSCNYCNEGHLLRLSENGWYCDTCHRLYSKYHSCSNDCILTPEQFLSGKDGCLVVEHKPINGDKNNEWLIITNVSKYHKKIICIIHTTPERVIEIEPCMPYERLKVPLGTLVTLETKRQPAQRTQRRKR